MKLKTLFQRGLLALIGVVLPGQVDFQCFHQRCGGIRGGRLGKVEIVDGVAVFAQVSAKTSGEFFVLGRCRA